MNKQKQQEFEDILELVSTSIISMPYGIFDTKKNKFIKLRKSKKFSWEKQGHAKNAFINAVKYEAYMRGIRLSYPEANIESQNRYIIKRFNQNNK